MKMKHFVTKIVLAQLIMMVCASIAPAQVIQLLGYTNYTWRYNDVATTANNPQATFMTSGFDDTGADWKTGRALFGNDGPDIYNTANHPFRGGINGFATPLDRGPGANRVTFYFRTHFNVSTLAPGATLYSTNYLDDGAAFYINGVEVGRTRVPAGALTFDTLGSNPTEGAPTRVDMPGNSLVVGDNVLAVEVHQSSIGSSDVAFGMNLFLINPFCVQILDPTQPADASVVENRSFTLRAVADASPPIAYQWVKDGVDITGATSPTYSVQWAQTSDSGAYLCRISNPVCTNDTRTATVTVAEDETPPDMIGALAPNFTTVVVQFNEAMDPTAGLGVSDAFNWSISDGANIFGIADSIGLSADGKIVTLTILDATLAQDTVYTVSVTGVPDRAGNVLEADEASFRSFTTAGCTTFLFEAFDTLSTPGNAVALLTSHPNYPNNPQDRVRVASFDSRHGYANDSHEQYGGRLRGLFVPTITGPHTFYLASDDAGQLFVNPNGPDAAGKQLVAQEINCCGDFQAPGDPRTSVPINLTAGQAYYVEALYKEGTGGDWLKVAARPSGDVRPPGPNSTPPNSAISPDVIQAGAGPAGILGHITIANHPANANAIAGQPVMFSVGLSSDVPGCFQWKKDGVDIVGAIGPTYRFITSLADDQTRYSVEVSLMGGTVLLSSEALLSVIEDVTGPTVTGASLNAAGNVVVTFSENVGANATTVANYLVDGVAPASATATNNVVTLVLTSPLASCPVSHSVRVSAVTDPYGNVVNPNPTTVNFDVYNLLLAPISATHAWRYEDSGNALADSWFTTGFDDSTWPSGPGTLAFPGTEVIQDGYPVRTTLAAMRLTTYFRSHFNLPTDPSTVTNLQLQVIIDDGTIFYLNGQELTRVRMPAGAVAFDTLSSAGSPSDPPQILETLNLPASLLVGGDNVIAARVHQSSATSSDTVFAAGVVAQVTGCAALRPRLSISINGNQVTITSTGAGTLHQAPALSGPWSPVGPAPQTLTVGPGNTFFEIRP